MNLQDWDRLKVGGYLQAIGRSCARMSVHASRMKELLDELPVRPVWKTIARDELAKSKKMVLLVLEGIEAAEQRYDDEIAIELDFNNRDNATSEAAQ